MDVGSDGNGVSNADFILYVSAKTTGSCPTEASEGSGSPSTIAFASSCQMESALDRLYNTINYNCYYHILPFISFKLDLLPNRICFIIIVIIHT